jgi:hypothetical protein
MISEQKGMKYRADVLKKEHIKKDLSDGLFVGWEYCSL